MTNKLSKPGFECIDSYLEQEANAFYPCDEVIKFVSQHIRRRVGLEEVIDVYPSASGSRVIDIGCGIGSNLLFGNEMGLDMYGTEYIPESALVAQEWFSKTIGSVAKEHILLSDVRELPWKDCFFSHAISDRALDRVPFELAQAGVSELARVVAPSGYFYCNLISGDETGRDANFCGDVVLHGEDESKMTQSYFNHTKVKRLIEPLFEILSCQLSQITDPIKGTRSGRWHIVSRRR